MNIDTDKLRKKLEKNREKGSGGKADPRFLNYYDLDFGQEIVVRLLPDGDDSGDLFKEYAVHGPNLRNPNVERISCAYSSNGEKCPACGYSYGFHQNGDKEAAKQWRTKENTIAQCVVINSPIELNEAEDGNPVKLMYLPWGMKESIVDAILNGTIDDPTAVNFVIKKTKNQGGRASYDKSFFKINDTTDIPEDFFTLLEEGTAYLYNLGEEIPAPATADEVQEWLDDAIEKVNGNTSKSNSSSSSNDDDGQTDDGQSDEGQSSDDNASEGKKHSSNDLMSRLKNRQRK